MVNNWPIESYSRSYQPIEPYLFNFVGASGFRSVNYSLIGNIRAVQWRRMWGSGRVLLVEMTSLIYRPVGLGNFPCVWRLHCTNVWLINRVFDHFQHRIVLGLFDPEKSRTIWGGGDLKLGWLEYVNCG